MSTIKLPQKKYVASFDIDAQNTFTHVCPNELPVPEGIHIVDELNAQAALAAIRIGSKDAHSPQAVWVASADKPPLTAIEGHNVDLTWPLHAVPGTKGFELIDGLPHPKEYDFFIWKGIELDMHPYGACYHDLADTMSTGVIEYLRSKNITTIMAGGLATDYCVKITVLQLLKAGFSVIVNLEACRGIAEDTIKQAKQQMTDAGARFINSYKELEQ